MTPQHKKLYHKKQRQKKRKSTFRKWHRRLGFTVSLLIFNLAITGILLNHYESLSLHTNHIKSELLLDWYDIKAPQKIDCFKLISKDICQVDNFIYAVQEDPKLLNQNSKMLINVIEENKTIFLATIDNIYIYDQTFNLIDTINIKEEFLSSVNSAFALNQQIYLQAEEQWLIFDEVDYLFVPVDKAQIQSLNVNLQLTKTNLTTQQYQLSDEKQLFAIKQDYRQKQISYLKLIQDMHSGQILARSGKWLTDITGIALLLLAISGFITWQRRKNLP